MKHKKLQSGTAQKFVAKLTNMKMNESYMSAR